MRLGKVRDAYILIFFSQKAIALRNKLCIFAKETTNQTKQQGGDINMAKRKTLKRNINQICTDLFAECIAMSLYGTDSEKENAESLMHSIIKIESDFISRISHTEPGMTAKAYFKDLITKFKAQITEIADQISISE